MSAHGPECDQGDEGHLYRFARYDKMHVPMGWSFDQGAWWCEGCKVRICGAQRTLTRIVPPEPLRAPTCAACVAEL